MHMPVSLSCGHWLCLECASSTTLRPASDDANRCPLCKRPSEVPTEHVYVGEVAEALFLRAPPTSPVVLEEAAAAKGAALRAVFCADCAVLDEDYSVAAEVQCDDCDRTMCASCGQAHALRKVRRLILHCGAPETTCFHRGHLVRAAESTCWGCCRKRGAPAA